MLSDVAPLRLAEDWDNVGLLVGRRKQEIARVMTCLTITPGVVDEAIERNADLIVAHHPLPFFSLKKVTADTPAGDMLLRLISGNVAIYSAHTAFDSAETGVNQLWCESLGLRQIRPLSPIPPNDSEPIDADSQAVGSGRYGELGEKIRLAELAAKAAAIVQAKNIRVVGQLEQMVKRVASACGSGGSFLPKAKHRGCDVLITGEATFHDCLLAEAEGIALVLLGHYSSERFAMERLAESLSELLPGLTIWPSQAESDPITPFHVD